MTYDASSRKDIRAAEKSAKIDEHNRLAYVRRVMSDTSGRTWMHGLLESCNVFHTPFVSGSPDVTSFNCGRQNVGLSILGEVVAHCPAEYMLMMKEAHHREIVDATGRDDTTDLDGRDGRSELDDIDAGIRNTHDTYDTYGEAE